MADAQSWDNAFRSLHGKAPDAKPNYVRFAAYVNMGSQRSRIGSTDTWYCTTEMSVLPIDLGIVVEEAYYLVGTVNGWDLASAVKFSHSDKNVYDDPVFTLSIDLTSDEAQAGWWWEDSARERLCRPELGWPLWRGDQRRHRPVGNLFKDGQAGQLVTAGPQLFTIDMLSCTYSVTNAVPALWTPRQLQRMECRGQLAARHHRLHQLFGIPVSQRRVAHDPPAPNRDNKYALGTRRPRHHRLQRISNLPVPEQGAGLLDQRKPRLAHLFHNPP